MTRRKGGSSRTPKKSRPTSSRSDGRSHVRQVESWDTGLLLDAEAALAWLSLNPQLVPAWVAANDAAISAVLDGVAPTNGVGEDLVAVHFFSRLTLCSLWVRHERPSADAVASADEREGWEELADLYDVPSAVAAWRAGREKRLVDRSHREARRALRLVRTPADLPHAVSP